MTRPECRVLAVIGPPGSGKTTQIELLRAHIGADRVLVAGVPHLVRRRNDLVTLLTTGELAQLEAARPAALAARATGDLAPLIFDRLLFTAARRALADRFVVLDGAPRGVAAAKVFLEMRDLAPRTTIVNLRLPDDERAYSLRRQRARERARRGAVEAVRREPVFRRKYSVYANNTTWGLELLIEAGIRCVRTGAAERPEQVQKAIVDVFGNTDPVLL